VKKKVSALLPFEARIKVQYRGLYVQFFPNQKN